MTIDYAKFELAYGFLRDDDAVVDNDTKLTSEACFGE